MSKHTEKLELIAIDKLIPYANNARTHSDEQIKKIQASLREFGFVNPVLIDKDCGIIAGHGRVEAAKREGMTEVPCVWVEHLTEAQKKAYILADNRLAEDAGWDFELLSVELEELKELDFDIGLTGFGADELSDILGEEKPEAVEDNYEVNLPEEPKAKLGDIYQLGNHRLMCGDSTDKATVEKLMNGVKADMVFTDPPYGINFVPQRGTHPEILNDNLDNDVFNSFLDDSFSNALTHMKPDTFAFIWTGWSRIGSFEASLKKYYKIQALHIWVKNNFGIGYYSRPKHEPFYLCLNGKPIYPVKAPADVWEYAKVTKTIHSCEKPIGLIAEIMDTYHKNSLVLDLFGGSGSTLIACEQTNRICYMMELDPKYCDVIIDRWETLTGEKAVKI